MSKNINIIYYIWINPERNWKIIIEGQLNDLKNSNILNNAKLYIIISASTNELLNKVLKFIMSILININNLTFDINTTLENNYEYEGMKKIYDIANKEPDKLFIYIHSKGMYHLNISNNNNQRFYQEKTLTRTLINPWKSIVEIFNNNKNIMKVGLCPALGGWIWFNFFWVRGDYIRSCENPKITDNRYYYESWLATSIMNEFDSYSIYDGNIKRYSGEEASNIISNLHY
jgi:hypothetical protein